MSWNEGKEEFNMETPSVVEAAKVAQSTSLLAIAISILERTVGRGNSTMTHEEYCDQLSVIYNRLKKEI